MTVSPLELLDFDIDHPTDFPIIGRLTTYRYYNMDQVTAMALTEADKLISRYGSKS